VDAAFFYFAGYVGRKGRLRRGSIEPINRQNDLPVQAAASEKMDISSSVELAVPDGSAKAGENRHGF
jgi:hypothetical protein